MRKRLFVDTWGWLQVVNKRESRHEEVSSFVSNMVPEQGYLVTNRYVIVETITLLYVRLTSSQAEAATRYILDLEDEDFLTIVPITESRFQSTLELRWRYQDKPGISFTDLSSMAVMDELGISDVLTGDAHFEHVGMGFRRRP